MNSSRVHQVPYTAAIVTFRRPKSLGIVLTALAGQSHPPSLTIVTDNDPEESARRVVENHRDGWPGTLVYAPTGQNLGPAGGWAHAVATAISHPHRGKWILVIDDDDPLSSPDVVLALLTIATEPRSRLAGIGLRGARWNKTAARLNRVEPIEGTTATVDYLAGNGAACYSWQAVEEVGFFNPDLFFGFEDLDLGFRLRRQGWTLVVAPMPSLHTVADTASLRTPWREYYKIRALTWIVRQEKSFYAVALTLFRSVLLGGMRLWLLEREPALFRARLLGAFDGLRGSLGARRFSPGTNPAKSLPSDMRGSSVGTRL